MALAGNPDHWMLSGSAMTEVDHQFHLRLLQTFSCRSRGCPTALYANIFPCRIACCAVGGVILPGWAASGTATFI